jgi:predicted metal-binding protein
MKRKKCAHFWEMVNLAPGLIVMKKCFHCRKVSTCFIFHNKPPLEPCYDGEHFWNFMESDASFHFDLRCKKCGTLVNLNELVGLMKCTGCDGRCEAGMLMRKLEAENTKVYIAVGARPIEERPQLEREKFEALEEYFKKQSESLESKIRIVPHKMVRDFSSCYAEVIRDADVLFAGRSEGT